MELKRASVFALSPTYHQKTCRSRGRNTLGVLVAFLFLFIQSVGGFGVSWDWQKWWTYHGISGPQFWGLINPEWSMCTHGQRQSPINIDPQKLLYDPNLRPLHVDKHKVGGVMRNTGQSIILTLGKQGQHYHPINITGGPLSYKYQVSHIQLHFGDKNNYGSEHTVNGTAFPAELQVYGYNSQLFNNFSEAVKKAHGVVAISVLLQVGVQGHPGLKPLIGAINRVKWGQSSSIVERIGLESLLSDPHHYITYDGSLTQPSCHETVTWIILNKSIFITKQQLYILRDVWQGREDNPMARLLNNYRPTQPHHHRLIRTNIDLVNSEHCVSATPQMYYTAKIWR